LATQEPGCDGISAEDLQHLGYVDRFACRTVQRRGGTIHGSERELSENHDSLRGRRCADAQEHVTFMEVHLVHL
jgi:hypothetical protein